MSYFLAEKSHTEPGDSPLQSLEWRAVLVETAVGEALQVLVVMGIVILVTSTCVWSQRWIFNALASVLIFHLILHIYRLRRGILGYLITFSPLAFVS